MAVLAEDFLYHMDDWEEEYQRRLQDHEATRNMCWAILIRTLQDVYTYRDRRNNKRKKKFQVAYEWLTEICLEDAQQRMSFVWVCNLLGLDPVFMANAVKQMERESFESLRGKLSLMRKRRSGLQREREEAGHPRGRSGNPDISL